MKTHLIVLLALSAGCVSISEEELAERQASYAFGASVVSATPAEAFHCADPGIVVQLAIDTTMAGVELQPTVGVVGGAGHALEPVVVPADGAVTLEYGEALPCDSGLCELELAVTLVSPEGASTTATTTVQRVADPDPEIGRQGVLSTGDLLVEGLELQNAIDDGDGALDVADFRYGYAIVSDPLFSDIDPDDLGTFRFHACPVGSRPGEPDCLTTGLVAAGVPLPGLLGDEKVLAFATEPLAPSMCDPEVVWQMHVGFTSDVCDGPELTAAILPSLRFQGDCDDDGATPAQGDCDDTTDAIGPHVTDEGCNGIDDDCDGNIGATEMDSDGDGYVACVGWSGDDPAVLGDDDCAPDDLYVHPGAVEVCNFADDDCDGTADNGIVYSTRYLDADGDGLGTGDPFEVCPGDTDGTADNADDCDDANDGSGTPQPLPEIHCADQDNDGAGSRLPVDQVTSCPGQQPAGYLPLPECNDCNDAVPGELATRLCFDDDEDGLGDYYDPMPLFVCPGENYDGNGYSVCEDCDDTDTRIGAVQLWPDGDGDGLGNGSVPSAVCEPPEGDVSAWVDNSDDCDDTSDLEGARYADGDGDGHAAIGAVSDCGLLTYVRVADDCDDEDYDFKPGFWRRGFWTGDTYLQPALELTGADPTVEICGEIEGADITGALAIVDAASGVTRIEGTPGYSTLIGRGAKRTIGVDSSNGLTLEGFTVTGDGDGGGILHNSGSLTLVDMVVEGCTNGLTGSGGGIVSRASLTLEDTVVRDNVAGDGGGIHAISNVTFAGVTRIEGNTATGDGGGIYLGGAEPQAVVGSPLVSLNVADNDGGGIHVVREASFSDGPRLNNNAATHRGGNLSLASGATARFVGGAWAGGTADLAGGGYVGVGGVLELTQVAVGNNEAAVEGGGVLTEGTLVLTETEFFGNTALGEPPNAGKPLPFAGQDVAVAGAEALLDTSASCTWESSTDGIVTRGVATPPNPPTPAAQGFDPTALNPGFSCDQGGCN